MKKFMAIFFILLGVCVIALLMKVNQNNKTKNEETARQIESKSGDLAKEWTELSGGNNTEVPDDFFDYLKEKAADGSFASEEGIEQAIREGGQKYGFTLDEAKSKELANTINTLEGFGFSTDVMINEAEKLYEEYGADYINHLEDAFLDTAKQVAEDAAIGLWDGFKDMISSFFE